MHIHGCWSARILCMTGGLVTLLSLGGWSADAAAQQPNSAPMAAEGSEGRRQPPPPPPLPFAPLPGGKDPQIPVFQKIGPGRFSLGMAQITKAARSVSLPAVVNMDKGALEYLLVRTGGKTHESLLRTDVQPTEVQLAMLLLGAEGTDRPLSRQGDPDQPTGNAVDVSVSYLRDGRMVTVHPSDWILKKPEGASATPTDLAWVFTGSTIQNGRFLAQHEGSMIAIYHDPAALIDNTSAEGDNDRIWLVNSAAVPRVGTPVTLTIAIK